MQVELTNVTPNAEKHIEACARVSHLSGKDATEDSTGPFIQQLIGWGHTSVLEHASATFLVSGVSRALTHQLVRHRIASYTQQSQRYVTEENFDYVVPPSIAGNEIKSNLFHNAMMSCNTIYKDLMELGVPKEDARFVLPNATLTQIAITMNFRALREFLEKRLDKSAQWEIRSMAMEMLALVRPIAPNVFYGMLFDTLPKTMQVG